MNLISAAQIKILHTLLNQLGLLEEKARFISDVSNGRTQSSRQLTFSEARVLIQHLKTDDSGEKMRKKIFALAYEAQMIWGETEEDKKMNGVKLKEFIKAKGAVKKELNKMTNAELVKTVSQFEQIVKHKKESHATKATKSLLTELNIDSSFRKPAR